MYFILWEQQRVKHKATWSCLSIEGNNKTEYIITLYFPHTQWNGQWIQDCLAILWCADYWEEKSSHTFPKSKIKDVTNTFLPDPDYAIKDLFNDFKWHA